VGEKTSQKTFKKVILDLTFLCSLSIQKTLHLLIEFCAIFIFKREKRKIFRSKYRVKSYGCFLKALYILKSRFFDKLYDKDNKKLLFCRPQGGLNDMLNQIEKCWVYALRYNRTLYIDCSRSGFLDSFENYFKAPKGVHLEQIDFLTPPFDCYPPYLSNDIENYEATYDKIKNNFISPKSGDLLTFDFQKPYKEQVLIHEQCGDGYKSIYMFEVLSLSDKVQAYIRKTVEDLGEYDAIHVRHSDYKTDYEKFFSQISDKLDKKIVLCTDSFECQSYAKSLWKERLHIVTKIPDTKGETLHMNAKLDRFTTNLDALTDLFILACSKNLYFTNIIPDKNRNYIGNGFVSGFGRLANALHSRKKLTNKLLYG
jgi:hypothetical protein